MPKSTVSRQSGKRVHKGMLMQNLKMIAVVALVWGNSAFAALSPSRNISGDDVQVQITMLLEHFAHKHPELNVQVRKKFSDYKINELNALQLLHELTLLDIIEEQHQPDPPANSLITVTCKRALCYNEEETESKDEVDETMIYTPGVQNITCRQPACLNPETSSL